jgi:hypothetical protein
MAATDERREVRMRTPEWYVVVLHARRKMRRWDSLKGE